MITWQLQSAHASALRQTVPPPAEKPVKAARPVIMPAIVHDPNSRLARKIAELFKTTKETALPKHPSSLPGGLQNLGCN